MYLVDEQYVMGFEIGQHRGQIAGLFQYRTRGLAQVDLHFVGDDMRQRGFTQPRRAEDQHVIERLATTHRGLYEDIHLLADFVLTDIFGEQPRP